ncbi:hypothetical protein H696_00705 [Fonticula alba]|uniref:Uncharacterized protein n=1 Tax=Fonticula alba TaxID=691883 RepID=A0A058ZI14_FONAL|nr:hypothetical protein H696_00705 [Fonticula alba]KCV73162.1 hypothetical protein H696_00705 [Fonticula alba]|eukprot:XP_009492863.1 hypothetical protein H696_00705 [Fonticula alba]
MAAPPVASSSLPAAGFALLSNPTLAERLEKVRDIGPSCRVLLPMLTICFAYSARTQDLDSRREEIHEWVDNLETSFRDVAQQKLPAVDSQLNSLAADIHSSQRQLATLSGRTIATGTRLARLEKKIANTSFSLRFSAEGSRASASNGQPEVGTWSVVVLTVGISCGALLLAGLVLHLLNPRLSVL